MPKNILIITTSLRNSSNSDVLAAEFQRGAKNAGHNVEVISLKDKNISFCKGCLACQKSGACIIKDDAVPIVAAMQKADVIAFSTPVYYYGLSGLLKTMLDRSNPLFPQEYAFRDIYLLITAADNTPQNINGPQVSIQGWINCFKKAQLKSLIFAGGVTMPGDIKEHSSLQKAFTAGNNIN